MKNVLNVLCSALVCLLLFTGIGLGVNSCTEGGIKSFFAPEEEVALSADQAVENMINPQLGSVSDVVNFHSTLTSNMAIDSTFMAMSELTIIDVASVLLKSNAFITKKDIVDEYVAHKNIYDGLPKPDNVETSTSTDPPIAKVEIVNEGKTTVTEAPPTRGEGNTVNSYKDTIIDGKSAIIKQ